MSETQQAAVSPTYILPPLRYGYDALEPFIDEATMRLHHDKHHQAYIDKVNEAIKPYPAFHGLIIEDLMRRLEEIPEEIRMTVRNNGGGHANHQFFWKVIGPPSQKAPAGTAVDAIRNTFGSFEEFQRQFNDAALKVFASGWTFLVINPQTRRVEILALPNQDSVLLHGRPGLLACDVWEHSYYLKYNNRRADYLDAFWKVVQWDVVSSRIDNFFAGKKQL